MLAQLVAHARHLITPKRRGHVERRVAIDLCRARSNFGTTALALVKE